MKKTDLQQLPTHVAIIMDGNGRWAKSRMLPRSIGHKNGMHSMIGLLEHAYDLGVDYVTVYALSTENLNRPKEELDGLFTLIREHFLVEMRKVCERGVRLKVLGNTTLLPKDVREIIRKAEEETACFEGKGLNIALAYGAREEIVRAVNKAIKSGEPLTEESLSKLLDTGNQPDPDLIIRTGKEQRLSNFLLYQAAYAELYFSDKMFPDFSDGDLEKAFAEYAKRTRRFGKTDEQREREKE